MSRLRPELSSTDKPCMSEESAFFRVMQAISVKRKLIHGRLHDNGTSCAIGCAFRDGVKVLPTSVVDEIAEYNDSFPDLTPQERWKKVYAWLKFRTKAMQAKKAK